MTGQNPPGHVPPGHLPQGHIPPVTYPLDTYPLDTYPLGHIPLGHLPPGHLPPGHLPPRTYTPQDIYPPDFKMPYLVHASCVDHILHFKTYLFWRNSIYLLCRCDKADRYLLCQEGLIPTTTQALDSRGGGGGGCGNTQIKCPRTILHTFSLIAG